MADGGKVRAFGGGDEGVGEEGHGFVFENAFVVLVVGAFVGGEGAGLGGRDGRAGDGMIDGTALGMGIGAGDLEARDGGVGGELVKGVVFAVGGGSDAAEEIGMGSEGGFGGFPDGGGVFVEGKFVENEIAEEAAGGAGIGGANADAAALAIDADAGFGVEGFEAVVGGEIDLVEGALEEFADFGAAAVEFDAVLAGVGKNGDGSARAADEAMHGPSGEGEGFAGLAAPKPDLNAVGLVLEGGELVGAEVEEGGFNHR